MSADSFVSSTRLRAPSSLSSRPSNQTQRLLFTRASTMVAASAATSGFDLQRGGVESQGLMDTRLSAIRYLLPNPENVGATADGEPMDRLNANAAGGGDHPAWLDLDRFEDWDLPELDAIRPEVRIQGEEILFPIAVAEDGSTLPSDLHPSYPYGDLHTIMPPYSQRLKAWPVNLDAIVQNDVGDSDGDPTNPDQGQSDAAGVPHGSEQLGQPASTRTRARQGVALNTPCWPFKRVGPGPGGPNALLRSEWRRPWRPYRSVWADTGSRR